LHLAGAGLHKTMWRSPHSPLEPPKMSTTLPVMEDAISLTTAWRPTRIDGVKRTFEWIEQEVQDEPFRCTTSALGT
jgi:hypothetical protein